MFCAIENPPSRIDDPQRTEHALDDEDKFHLAKPAISVALRDERGK